ncbi:MAG: nitroreductase/quinone reductase family protein [Candidatus Dormiibacterota bacterium]
MGWSARLQQEFLRFHGWVYRSSNGLIGHHMIGVPTLLLETTGRHSGERRINALVYASDGHALVVVASNGGSDRPPAWLLNLRADPEVAVQRARRRTAAQARVVSGDDPEYGRLWRLVNQTNHGRYDVYQSKTQRSIPLVVLTPI